MKIRSKFLKTFQHFIYYHLRTRIPIELSSNAINIKQQNNITHKCNS